MKSRCAFWLLGFLLIGACSGKKAQPPAVDGKVVFILFDLSGSTVEQKVRQMYFDTFKRILEKVGPGDIVVADAISDNPLSRSSFPINHEFHAFSALTDNPIIHRKKVEGQRKEILEIAKALLFDAGEASKFTKILDSILLAHRVFRTYHRPKQVLIVFSDMIEESENYNFQRQELSDRGIEHILSGETNSGRIPELKGVRVYVVGASAGTYEKSSSERFLRVQKFWLEYFKRCGADLPVERYGASLLEFKE